VLKKWTANRKDVQKGRKKTRDGPYDQSAQSSFQGQKKQNRKESWEKMCAIAMSLFQPGVARIPPTSSIAECTYDVV
jgi:hypothetical protein